MKYFLIAGEASGDLHGAQLVAALRDVDSAATFTFLGGDAMAVAAGTSPLIHYRDMAFMGFIEVVKHLRSILGFMSRAKRSIESDRPDALILIDYPSFNLKMAKWASRRGIPVYYFISPKVWAWKQWRVKDIRRYVDRVFSILPFEVEWYRQHDYKVDYVGNPTVKEVAQARESFDSREKFVAAHDLDPSRGIIAILPGSRRKEIRDNLPAMLDAARRHADGYQAVVAGAPAIEREYYADVMGDNAVSLLEGKTMELVANARVALVTSGTATLETAVLGTPQVACYRMNGSKLVYKFYSKLIHGKYVTLPNLITDSPVIPELLLHLCTEDSIDAHLAPLLDDGDKRQTMLDGYAAMMATLGDSDCAAATAEAILDALRQRR